MYSLWIYLRVLAYWIRVQTQVMVLTLSLVIQRLIFLVCVFQVIWSQSSENSCSCLPSLCRYSGVIGICYCTWLYLRIGYELSSSHCSADYPLNSLFMCYIMKMPIIPFNINVQQRNSRWVYGKFKLKTAHA